MKPAISVGLSAKLCIQGRPTIRGPAKERTACAPCLSRIAAAGHDATGIFHLLLGPFIAALAEAILRAGLVGGRKLQKHGPLPVNADVAGCGLLPFRLDGLAAHSQHVVNHMPHDGMLAVGK